MTVKTHRFGITNLKKIHLYIFQRIYPFAGKFRMENIHKDSTEFCKSQYIEENLKAIFHGLKQEEFLKSLNVEPFSQKAVYYLSELNKIHPFREGNGRTIREFIRQLAMHSGYIINFFRRGFTPLVFRFYGLLHCHLTISIIYLFQLIYVVVQYRISKY